MESFNGAPDFAHLFEMEKLKKKIEDLTEQLTGNQQIIKEEKYSHYVQMLILDYLGIGKKLKTNVEKAKLYAPLLRRDLKTTEQYFSELKSFKNEKNLLIIIDFFDKAELPTLVQEVKDDLDRLKKRKN